jgi:predicted RNase H-like HicB family nuclease
MYMALKITASVRGATRKDEQTGIYVAFCPTLQIYSQGIDESRARAALESAVKLFLGTCLKHGSIDRALRERGFSEVAEAATTNPKQQMGEFVAIERYDEAFEFEVPLFLLNSQEKASIPC